MYESHFGLTRHPFQLHADPSFLFESSGHAKALSYLRYGAQQGEGFVVITGEVGAGKTTLVQALMNELDPQAVVAAKLSNTQLEAPELLQAILTAYEVPTEGRSKARLLAMLEAFLTAVVASGRRALLIVDEAQNLEPAAIEELRLLSNLQLGHHGLLQCFLVGQPSLRSRLQAPAAEQLRQRVLASYHLGPMEPAETAAYVRHRLALAGGRDRPVFDEGALAAVHRCTGGIPRRINLLCHRVLLSACIEDRDSIDAALIEQTARELHLEVPGPTWPASAVPAAVDPALQAPLPVPDESPVAPATPDAALPLSVQAGATACDFSIVPELLESAETPQPGLATLERAADAAPVEHRPASTTAIALEAVPAVVETTAWPSLHPPVVLATPELADAGSTARASDVATEASALSAPAHSRMSHADADELTAADGAPEVHAAPPANDASAADAALPVADTVPEEGASVATSPVRPVVAPVRLAAAERPQAADATVSPASPERRETPRGAVLCVADEPLSWHKLRCLARPWSSHTELPPMLLVNPGLRSVLQRSWTGQVPSDAAVADVHLGVGAGPVGQTHAAVALRFAELAAECSASAVVLAGTSPALVQCGLLAHELGLPVIRVDAGQHRGDVESGRGTQAALIDRLADLLCVPGDAEQQALTQEGHAAERQVRIPSLTARVLADLQPQVPAFSELMARLGPSRAWLTRAAVGFGLISAQFEADDVSPGDALQWLMLARYGSTEIPLLWPVSDRTAAVMRDPSLHLHLEAAGIATVRSHDYFELLSLLGRARCLVAGPSRTLVDEAAAQGIPSIVVQLYADTPAHPETGLVTRVGPSAGQFKAAVRSAFQLIRHEGAAPGAAEDGHRQLVEQLGRWLPRHVAPGIVPALDEAAA